MNNGNAPSLKGKTAVVTGASSGIGRAIAEKLGAAGAHVYLAGRTAEAMDASKAQIEKAGGRATPSSPTCGTPRRSKRLVQRAADETGRLDIMVNNAGVSHPSKIVDADPTRMAGDVRDERARAAGRLPGRRPRDAKRRQ